MNFLFRKQDKRLQPNGAAPRFFDRLFDALFRYFGAATPREKLVLIVAIAVVFGYAELLLIMDLKYHAWVLDQQGHPLLRDFVAFWSAGHEALSGRAHAAYNPALQHAAEVARIGRPYQGMLGWSYPPIYLFVAAALALLPYTASFLVWCLATWLFQAAVVAKIAGRRSAFVLALAAPWALIDIWIGQNGLLTAALVGLILLHLKQRPLISGLLLGVLSYKPQFGVLFPLALAAAGYWRAFGWAAFSVIALNGLAGLVFGFDTLSGFFGIIGFTGQTHLNGGIEWRKLQSVYALVRVIGGTGPLAMAAQIGCSGFLAAAVLWSWHAKIAYTRKAAVLAAALPLATPYVFAYDLPVLAVALAFLYRERAFDRAELMLLAATVPLLFLYSAVPFPTALGASLIVTAIVARRFYRDGSPLTA